MLKVLGDGGVGRGVKDHDSGDRGGGRKNPFCTFAHVMTLKVIFSFFPSFFLSFSFVSHISSLFTPFIL